MADCEDEHGWIRKSQEGDHEAFAELVRRYQQMIHSLTYRMTGSMADAEDLAQETFIHAFRHLRSFRAEARFSSWLYRIAINLCLNWRKREARQSRILGELRQHLENDAAPDRTQIHAVQEALLKLKPKQRAAVILTTHDGLSHGEAARVLGCSETTVSWRLFAARRMLKKLLGGSQRRGE